MIIEITGRNAPQAYVEGLQIFRVCSIMEHTRAGPAMVLPAPTFLTIQFPEERLLNCPVRRVNPFFHCMEFIWMMAGSNDASWISQFNKRMMEYADDGILRGAYGYRWTNPTFQIPQVIDLLHKTPGSRQAVLSMWDTVHDGPNARTSDRPCNTHIYFRVDEADNLNMTVCNRSNDFIWGMLGANVVHMTMLQELVASAAGFKLGMYHVFSNNCHIYTDVPRYEDIIKTTLDVDMYKGKDIVDAHMPLLEQCTHIEFIEDCVRFVDGEEVFQCPWIQHVAWPIKMAYLDRSNRYDYIEEIVASDWHRACWDWETRRIERKKLN